jgi:hypothetical protein
MFYCARYAARSGLNSTNLDFLPVQNIEEIDMSMGGFGAVPVGMSSLLYDFLVMLLLSNSFCRGTS